MSAPFQAGDRAVHLSPAADGIRVRQTVVLSVEREGDRWSVRTAAGTELVDDRGESSQLLPLDSELRELVEAQGPSFVIGSEQDDSRRQHEHEARRRELDRQRDQHRDTGRDR